MRDGSIEVTAVSKTYRSAAGAVPALQDISLSVASNEFVSVIGPTGCGKTTLLKIVAGLVDRDAGEVLVGGESIAGPAPERIAMVFQNFALLPWETVLDNVLFAMQRLRLPKAEMVDRARSALARVNLTGFEKHRPHELSGGMQQRVGLARALSVDTPVLLMDEPFGAVDAQTRRVLQEDLLRLWQEEEKTVLFITHAMDEAVYLSDRVVIMKPRPARIDTELAIGFERPRDAEALQRDPAFVEYQSRIWDTLSKSAREIEFAGHEQS